MKPFFRRKQEERGEIPQIYQRKNIPQTLKTQIWLELKQTGKILIDASSDITSPSYIPFWNIVSVAVYNKLQKDTGSLGVNQLDYYANDSYLQGLFFNGIKGFNPDEIMLTIVEDILNFYLKSLDNFSELIDKRKFILGIIDSVNYRFRESRVGYQYNIDSNCILPFDDEIIFKNAIEPTFNYLNISGYEKAKSSYKSAYEYFLDKKYDDCVRHTCLALESAIRTVLQKKGIALSEKDGLSKFIDLLFDNKVIPMEHSDFASGLKNVFKEIPKFKNKNSGHGLSEFDKRKTSEAKAKLVLNLAATLITFMAEID